MKDSMIVIRAANERDAEEIVRLIKNSFNPELLQTIIYGCHGVLSYVRDQITTPKELSDTKYMVIEDDHELIGCAEYKIMKDTVFLNYICTHESRRGKGLGKLLMKEVLCEGIKKSMMRMELDVFYHNISVKKWYEKLGFSPQYNTVWWKIPLTYHKQNATAFISGFPQAQTCFDKFGFSSFQVISSNAIYSIGYLGEKWFRIQQLEVLNECTVMNSLYLLDSNRTILGLFPEEKHDILFPAGEQLCKSVRMGVSLHELSNILTTREV